MYLKRIDILGFKSFANKTTVRFSSGLTAIVGPNGCGKTNILDALRWVLGEQRPTLLRGGKMDEVIFNGTSDAKPLGMSEVTLTVVNDRGILTTEYNEIQITRRLFRSGESEYLLNKTPCRLKDITDLFVDTGMGAHSYSVIQPDMIDAVISDKAEERRFLFEEAAGITKYKHRRKAALRKLEATENDFLRLRDIYAEVKTRVNSLYRQHKKAERYQKIVDEIRTWDLFLASSRISVLDREKRELKAESDTLSGQKLAHETELNQFIAQLEAARNQQIDFERRLNEISGEIYSISEQAHSLEREISVLGEKKTNAENLIVKNQTDIEALESRLATLTDQIESAQREAEIQSHELDKILSDLADAEQTQAETDRRLMASRTNREEENRKLIELEGKLSSDRTEEHGLQQQQQELVEQLAQINGSLEVIEPKQTELITRRSGCRQKLDQLTSDRNEATKNKNSLSESMEDLTESSEELSLEITDLKSSLEAAEASRRLLEEMILHYEGYESGVVVAMEHRERWPGITGTVAENFIPVEGMEMAVEAALGDIARFLICSDRKTAEEIIEHLRSEKKGKIGILVPDTGTITAVVKRPVLEFDEVIGWLDNYISTTDNLLSLKDAILSRTVVFRAGADPTRILERLPYGFSAVSTDGIVYRSNLISGGSDDRFPLFRRQEKVDEQVRIIEEMTHRLNRTTEQRSQVVAQLAAARAGFNQENSRLEDLTEEIETAQKEAGEVDFEHRDLQAQYERLNKEKQTLSTKLEQIRNRQTSLDLDSTELATRKNNLVADMDRAAHKLEDIEAETAAANERVSRLQVASIEARSKVEQTQNGIAHFNELRSDIENSLRTRKSEIESARVDIHQSAERMAVIEKEMKKAFLQREEKNGQQEKTRETQSELLLNISAKEKQIKELRNRRDSIGDSLHEVEIRLNTIDSETRSVTQRVFEEYEVDVRVTVTSSPSDKISDEDAPAYLLELKERIRKFGAVNLLALEEYREASEREKFLNEQLSDLETARDDLKSTISRINLTARKMFSDTLEKVQVNFKNLFVELFTGGDAGIRLVNPDDPLESDIEIIARPRGKKLLSITMMSGGERALTAIALLFSLYLVKPSPFCILDEIDAPLDDANCHRFLRIINTFSRQTQFIIITHNKITMEAATNLYGITMEQPGISRLVAVRFGSDNGDEGAPVQIETSVDEPTSTAPALQPELPESIQERLNPEIPVSRKDDA